ncbi:23S rRNA (pseudouridine(1915)-N(3))-methyltransferase RlmH [Lutispora sp.]|jgi:23S rRNA (pseudouridine1915-N3)-methyltransferase|uniref:23S rRNA (pseudouridine(1915)-N(3))-methyltransferase RlmH n=1 Tax=Lutispora sp. TaxID=2828727 RepID=UPI00356A208B
MNISIITVGKLKEKYLKEAVSEYSKRLSKYCKLEIIEVPDEKAPETMSRAEEEAVKQKEGQAVLKHVKNDTYVVALAIDGKMLSSEGFSEFINSLGIRGKSNIAFIIGGSLGLSDEVLRRADYKLSFSPMTFPHQLMRVILLEQIYRGFKIMRGEVYHK